MALLTWSLPTKNNLKGKKNRITLVCYLDFNHLVILPLQEGMYFLFFYSMYYVYLFFFCMLLYFFVLIFSSSAPSSTTPSSVSLSSTFSSSRASRFVFLFFLLFLVLIFYFSGFCFYCILPRYICILGISVQLLTHPSTLIALPVLLRLLLLGSFVFYLFFIFFSLYIVVFCLISSFIWSFAVLIQLPLSSLKVHPVLTYHLLLGWCLLFFYCNPFLFTYFFILYGVLVSFFRPNLTIPLTTISTSSSSIHRFVLSFFFFYVFVLFLSQILVNFSLFSIQIRFSSFPSINLSYSYILQLSEWNIWA